MERIMLDEIIGVIEEHYPRTMALEWDNPGLLCGSRKKEVHKLMIALDATDRVVDRAVSEGCDLVLTHHPLIFGSIKNVNDESFIGRRLIKLIKNDMSLYAMHTNFDVAREGMGHIVAERLGVREISPLELTGEDQGMPIGVGFYGELESPMDARELALLVKERFGIGQVIYYDGGRPISRVASCPGSGRGMLSFARDLGADCLITGDMGHHDGIDAAAEGMTLIDAGHFGLEHIYVPYMKDFVGKHFPGLEILTDETDERKFV